MITAREIRRTPPLSRAFYILTPSIAITLGFSLIMSRIVDSIYSNFVAGFTDTIHTAPPQYASLSAVGNIIVLVFCLIFFYAWLGSTKIEEILE